MHIYIYIYREREIYIERDYICLLYVYTYAGYITWYNVNIIVYDINYGMLCYIVPRALGRPERIVLQIHAPAC